MHVVDTHIEVRLDRYLKRLNPKLTQGVIEKALRQGKIKVNNKKVESALRIQSGDKLFIAEALTAKNTDEEPTRLSFSPNTIKLAEKLKNEYLLFENEYFLVINKPARLATQGGSKINLSIDDALNYLNYTDKTELKLVHRLDKETSGVLLIAKTLFSANKLAQSFQDKIIEKTYIAIVYGYPPKDTGEISNLIAKNREGVYDKVQEDLENGKLAITRYKVIKKSKELSLIEFTPLTGRTHQLRVHAQMLGCSIIGDDKYGSQNHSLKYDNMLLHAKNITLPEEIFGKKFTFEAQIPAYFKKFIEEMK